MPAELKVHAFARSRVALAVSLALVSISAARAADEVGPELQEMVITGTRIVQPNLTSTSPVQVVTGQEFKLQGATDTINLLNGLPQFFQNNATDFSNTSNPLLGPGGVTTVDLRGLGPQRTLVLVDGKRLGTADAYTGNTNPSPNIDQIPAALIQRVDVVTGGASAVYGSDAIAGVVNFIMKHDFEGVQVDAQYSFNQHHNGNSYIQGLLDTAKFPKPNSNVIDGRTPSVSLIAGANGFDGRANITVYLDYREAPNVSQANRDFSSCKLNVANNKGVCSGSPNSNEFIDSINGNFDYQVSGNTFVDWGTAPDTKPPALFNSNPYQSLSRNDERYMAGFFSHYDVSPAVKLYADFSYMNDSSKVSTAPSGLFEGSNPYNITTGQLVNCDNPYLSGQQRTAIGCSAADITAGNSVDLIIGRRNIEGGARLNTYDHENYRFVTGVRGDLGSGWNYDVYGQYYHSSVLAGNYHYLSWLNANRALQVRSVGGVPTCIAKITGDDSKCVPYNIFAEGGVTPEALAYVDSYGIQYGTVIQKIAAGNISGDLGQYGIKLPWASTGVGVAGGVEYRSEAEQFTPDKASLSGDLSGFGGELVAINNGYDVREVYGEVRVPLIDDKPGIRELALDGGYRYSDYSIAGGISTYKGGLQYAPVQDLRFRASYQRAIRAPNIIELFNPNSVTNSSEVSSDPCAGAAPTATLAQCAHTGVTAAQYGHITQCPAGQCSVLNGGNTTLKPEEADTVSFGFTVTPSALPEFNASVDYFRVKVDNEINKVPLDTSLSGCLTANTAALCKNIVRTVTGNLFGATAASGGYIDGRPVNIAEQVVSGIDFQAAYRWLMPADLGTVTFSFAGSWLDSLKTTPLPDTPSYDCAGLYGAKCQTVNPEWRHSLRASWKTPWLNDLLISAQWRYIGKVDLETNSSDPSLTNGKTDTFEGTLAGISYLDLSTIWSITQKFSVRAGINNILDKDPPLVSSLIAGTGTPNTYPTYELLGRNVFVGFTATF